MQWRTDYSDQKQYRQYKHQQKKQQPGNKNGEKNNCMDISSDKQEKCHTKKTLTWLRKEKPQERNWISSYSSAEQRHKDYVKAKLDKTQQISTCTLCRNSDETMNRIISECSKLALKEYKTRHGWVGEIIHWELCKKLKSDHAIKYAQSRICLGK